MSPWFLVAVTALYAAQMFVCLYSGQGPQALLLFGYVIANFGLMLSMA